MHFMQHVPGLFQLKISSMDNKHIAQILREQADKVEARPDYTEEDAE